MPRPREIGTTGASPFVPGMMAVASALLLWLSFPPVDLGWPAWIALAPLFTLARSGRSRRSIYLGAWAGGVAFWALAIRWVRLTDETAWMAWLAMTTLLSAWWPAVIGLTRLATQRLRLPLVVAAPLAWTAGEFIQAYVFTGFPWYYLAHSQYRYLPVIQVADLAGTAGISLLVAMSNAVLAELAASPLLRPTPAGPRLRPDQAARVLAFGVLFAANLLYGSVRIRLAQFRTGPRVALLQSDFAQHYPSRLKSEDVALAMEGLMARAVAAAPRPDLIVGTETSYPYGFARIDPALTAAEYEARALAISRATPTEFWHGLKDYTESYFRAWASKLKTAMVVGATTYDLNAAGQARYNSAVLVNADGTSVHAYHKQHLVPFGEYIPFMKTLPWLAALTPFDPASMPGLATGTGPSWFDIGPYRYATAICFEDTIARVYRRSFSEAPAGREPDLILNLTNDGWFRGSSEAPDMHLALSVFRAVECRAPLARAVNTGITALIDGNGAILASLERQGGRRTC